MAYLAEDARFLAAPRAAATASRCLTINCFRGADHGWPAFCPSERGLEGDTGTSRLRSIRSRAHPLDRQATMAQEPMGAVRVAPLSGADAENGSVWRLPTGETRPARCRHRCPCAGDVGISRAETVWTDRAPLGRQWKKQSLKQSTLRHVLTELRGRHKERQGSVRGAALPREADRRSRQRNSREQVNHEAARDPVRRLSDDYPQRQTRPKLGQA